MDFFLGLRYFSIGYFLLVYSYAYYRTISTILRTRAPVNSVSFLLFAIGSTLGSINAFHDGSLAPGIGYLLLALWGAGTVVANEYIKRKIRHDLHMHSAWQDSIDYMPHPLSVYDKKGKPVVWNKALAEVTGYSHREVERYFEEHGEVVSLLYDGEELDRVREHLSGLYESGGYEDVVFTLRTKKGQKVRIAWTTSPYHGGSMRRGWVVEGWR